MAKGKRPTKKKPEPKRTYDTDECTAALEDLSSWFTKVEEYTDIVEARLDAKDRADEDAGDYVENRPDKPGGRPDIAPIQGWISQLEGSVEDLEAAAEARKKAEEANYAHTYASSELVESVEVYLDCLGRDGVYVELATRALTKLRLALRAVRP